MEEWKTYRLEDLTIDGKGHYGIGAPAVDYDENKFTYLRITDINDDGSLNYSGLKSVDDPEASKYLLQEGDIVFARTGNSTGRSYYYEPSDGQFVFAGFLIKFSLDPTKVNPRFLKYYTHSKMYYEWVQSFDTGATRGNINAQTFGSMEINLPPREVQDRLVEILRSIDDKIKLNNRINHNLEEQAQALYKSWFVDFEPFKDGKFVDSELGMIPEGWRVATLGEITLEMREKVGTRQDVKVLSPVTTGQLVLSEEFFTKQVFSESIAKYLIVRPNDFAYNPARVNIGSLGKNEFDFDGCVSPVYVVFRCETGYEHFFDLYRTMKPFKEEVISRSNGGVRQTLGYKDFALIKLVYPPMSVIKEFNTIYGHMLMGMKQCEKENTSLAKQRDELLPKLMMGDICPRGLTC